MRELFGGDEVTHGKLRHESNRACCGSTCRATTGIILSRGTRTSAVPVALLLLLSLPYRDT